MDNDCPPTTVLHWNYRGFTKFPLEQLSGEESDVTDIYLKENLISNIPADIGKLVHLESLYLSGNDITELPGEISLLRCLKCLDVSGNRLRRVPDEIGDVRGLKFLILDENEIEELPLRLAELKQLRYLSVCDNRLTWLPQKPVYNYHHCEFRFWRNVHLKSIPYSLWYHMFRGQQTRCLNIGCVTIGKNYIPDNRNYRGCRLKISTESRERTIDVQCPPHHNVIMESIRASPPSLYEMSKRVFYEILSDTSKRISIDCSFSSYDDRMYSSSNIHIANIEQSFDDSNIDDGNQMCDFNGNNLSPMINNRRYISDNRTTKDYFSIADVLNKLYRYLPAFFKKDLSNGPSSRCENVGCQKPVFDFAIYEFCLGQVILIDNVEEVILSATLCSRSCADIWKRHKTTIPWEIIKSC